MEQVIMKLEVQKNEIMSQLNEVFRRKVQLEEEVKENEVHLQFLRGTLHGLEAAQKAVKGIQQGEQIEAMRAKNTKLPGVPGDDGNKDKKSIPGVKV